MPDALILSTLGIEIEVRAWRGTDNVFDATITVADGSALPGGGLTNYDVTWTIVDRAGGTVQYSETNTPADHVDETRTRFTVGASIGTALTEQRAYTWKHQLVIEHRITGQKHVWFYGDFRWLTPRAPV